MSDKEECVLWDSVNDGDEITLVIKNKPSVTGIAVKDYDPNACAVKNKYGLWAYSFNSVEQIITESNL